MILNCAPTSFIRGYNPIWSFVDLQAKQFDDTFYMWVLENTIPYNLATVFQDPSGTIPWTQPIQFLANGTLPDNIYFANNHFYRLEFRKNLIPPPTQNDQLIYLVENYNPSNETTSVVSTMTSTVDNQMSNAQFSVVNFSGQYALTGVTNPPAVEIAPGWTLDLSTSGTGNVTVTQIPLNDATSSPTNAPYALHIQLNGFANQGILRQRFQQNGMNWANQNVASSFTARTTSGSPMLLAQLFASNGAPLALLSTSTLTSSFAEYQGNATLPASGNADLPPNAFIDYRLLIPGTCDIYVTSFQIVLTATPQNVAYEQETIDRQLDFLAHYYQPKLAYKPIPSYLIGWDFPLNPTQPLGPGTPGTPLGPFATANNAFYVWDQTIVYQTVTNGFKAYRDTNGGLTLLENAVGQVALVQYLEAPIANKIIQDRASVRMSASTNHAGGLSGNVTLWATTDASLPTLGSCFITTLGATGIPATVSSVNWMQIPNIYQDTAFTLQAASSTNSESADIVLSGWDLQGAAPANTATFFAIVVGFSAWANLDTINFSSISLCPGDIPSRPSPKSISETTLGCQRYFYSTFAPGTAPATQAGINSGFLTQQQNYTGTSGTILSLVFPTTMRATNSTVKFYNPVNNNAFAYNTTRPGDCSATLLQTTAWSRQNNLSISIADSVGSTTQVFGLHLTADARLGVV